MKTIELKPKPLLFVARWFVLTFSLFYLAKHCAYGLSLFHDPDFLLILRARAIEALVPTVGMFLIMAIPFYRGSLNIILTDTGLQAPVWKRGYRWETITVDLSDLSVSRTLKAKLRGEQLITNNGQAISIQPFVYAPKATSRLIDEIERRQKTIPSSSTLRCRSEAQIIPKE